LIKKQHIANLMFLVFIIALFINIMIGFAKLSNTYSYLDKDPDQPAATSIEIISIEGPEKYPLIEKIIIPDRSVYELGSPLRICVFIESLRYRTINETLENVSIYETINEKLKMSKKADYCCKLENTEQWIEYRKELYKQVPDLSKFKKYKIDWEGNTASMHVGALTGRQKVAYWYNISSSNVGVFDVETILKSGIYSDISKINKIVIQEQKPLFDVKLITLKSSNLYTDEPLKIVYDITYVGDSDYWNNTQVILDEARDYTYYRYYGKGNDTETNLTMDFKKFETRQISREILYPITGKYSPPGIWIGGLHYTFDETEINVDNFLMRHSEAIGLFFALLTLIISLAGIKFGKTPSDMYRYVKNETETQLKKLPSWLLLFAGIIIIISTIFYIIFPNFVTLWTLFMNHLSYFVLLLQCLFMIFIGGIIVKYGLDGTDEATHKLYYIIFSIFFIVALLFFLNLFYI
jgi:hypothetical protein